MLIDIAAYFVGADVAVFTVRLEEGGGGCLGGEITIKVEIDGQVGGATVVKTLGDDGQAINAGLAGERNGRFRLGDNRKCVAPIVGTLHDPGFERDDHWLQH